MYSKNQIWNTEHQCGTNKKNLVSRYFITIIFGHQVRF